MKAEAPKASAEAPHIQRAQGLDHRRHRKIHIEPSEGTMSATSVVTDVGLTDRDVVQGSRPEDDSILIS